MKFLMCLAWELLTSSIDGITRYFGTEKDSGCVREWETGVMSMLSKLRFALSFCFSWNGKV